MAVNLESMSAKELEALISQAKKRKTTLNKRKPLATVRAAILRQIAREGYSVNELFGTAGGATRGAGKAAKAPRKSAGARKSTGKVAPKYRNPENPAETWTGRGKQPRWLAAHTGAGRKLDEFAIK